MLAENTCSTPARVHSLTAVLMRAWKAQCRVAGGCVTGSDQWRDWAFPNRGTYAWHMPPKPYLENSPRPQNLHKCSHILHKEPSKCPLPGEWIQPESLAVQPSPIPASGVSSGKQSCQTARQSTSMYKRAHAIPSHRRTSSWLVWPWVERPTQSIGENV